MPRLALPTCSSLARAVIAAGVLFYALDLSAGDRGLVDWTVIGLASATVLWNLIQLGRLLDADGGNKAVWHLARTVLFWFLGLGNGVWVKPEDAGTWQEWVGWLLLVAAIADTVALALRERRILAARAMPGPER